jgi:hypothetical protein
MSAWVKIDRTRIRSYGKETIEYAAGLRYWFRSFDGSVKQSVTKTGIEAKLTNDTREEQRRGELKEDMAADGFAVKGGSHVYE